MKLTGKRLLYISGGIIGTAFLIAAIVFVSVLSYSSGLPELPDMKSLPGPLRKQLTTARKKAYFFPFAENLGRLGMILHSAGYYNEAAQCYNLVIRKDKENPRWHYYLGYLNLERSEMKSELENFREVIKQDPKNRMAMYYIGDALQGMNMVDEAEKYFSKVIETGNPILKAEKPERENYFPIRIYAMFNLGRIYLNSGRIKEAEKILKSVVSEQPTFGPAYRLLGNVYDKKGEQLLSKKNTIRAKDLVEYTPPVDHVMDELLLISRSESVLLKGIDQAIINHYFQWAQKLCDHALKYIPDNKYLLSKSIKVFMTTGKEKEAFSLVERHLKLSEKDFKELMEMADFFMDRGSMKTGIAYYTTAKKLEPEHIYLSLWLRKWNLKKEAYSVMKEQLDKNLENPKFLANACLILMEMGEKENARLYIAKLRKISPTNGDTYEVSGLFAYQENNISEAITNWKEAVKNEPTNVGRIKSLNKLFKQKQMWNESFLLLQLGLENNSYDPALLDEMAKLLITCTDQKIRNIKDGCEYAERAFYNYYSNFEIRMSAAKNVSTAYAMLGEKRMAEKFMYITLDLAKNVNTQEYITFFDGLRKQYKLN
jgi:tetratricopeptide (TPR) repeat protein